jgi:hypothetical protein
MLLLCPLAFLLWPLIVLLGPRDLSIFVKTSLAKLARPYDDFSSTMSASQFALLVSLIQSTLHYK